MLMIGSRSQPVSARTSRRTKVADNQSSRTPDSQYSAQWLPPDDEDCLYSLSDVTEISINVGGEVMTVFKELVEQYPKSKLAQLFDTAPDPALSPEFPSKDDKAFYDAVVGDDEDPADKMYYFDRSFITARDILAIYRNQKSKLHIPIDQCPTQFVHELNYWGLSMNCFSNCCCPSEFQNESMEKSVTRESNSNEHDGVGNGALKSNMDAVEAIDELAFNRKARGTCYARFKNAMWNTLEDPAYSKLALFFMAFSCAVVIASMVLLIMSSIVNFQVVIETRDPLTNETIIEKQSIPEVEYGDAGCVVFFTIDWLLRMWTCPSKLDYLKHPMTIIDMLAIVPFYIELIFMMIGWSGGLLGDVRRTVVILRILRVLRVLRALRVLKVARYSNGFQSMATSLQRSWKEIILLIMFIITTNLVFSTTVYYIEIDSECTMFPTIPAALWWCIITMTTVGYGDIYPCTTLGKICGCIAAISGIILMAFPISIIVGNFGDEYETKVIKPALAKDSSDAALANDWFTRLSGALPDEYADSMQKMGGKIRIELNCDAKKKRMSIFKEQ